MMRIERISGLCALLLIGWAAPAEAYCAAENCVARVAPQPIFIPPVALQQIETASLPFSLPAVAPPPASRDDTDEAPAVAGAAIPGGLASLADLDGGVADWRTIAPQASFDKLPPGALTGVATIHPARQKRPVPAKTEIALAANLSLAVPVALRPSGVPGIERTSSMGGNRSLWFAADSGR